MSANIIETVATLFGRPVFLCVSVNFLFLFVSTLFAYVFVLNRYTVCHRKSSVSLGMCRAEQKRDQSNKRLLI